MKLILFGLFKLISGSFVLLVQLSGADASTIIALDGEEVTVRRRWFLV